MIARRRESSLKTTRAVEYAQGRAGFSLVELVVALALGAMLMTALVGILRSVSNLHRTVQKWAAEDWKTVSLDLLRRDLMLASRIAAEDGWIWLDGEFPAFQEPDDRVKRVGYNCVRWIDQESVLVRVAGSSTDVVAVGPRRLLLERLDQTNTPQPLSPTPTAAPERMRLWIWLEGMTDPDFVCDIALR